MGWPQDGTWAALEDGTRLRMDGETWRLAVVDCGELALPSGRLVACDPFVSLERGRNPFVQVPAGRHRVRVTMADVSGRPRYARPGRGRLALGAVRAGLVQADG